MCVCVCVCVCVWNMNEQKTLLGRTMAQTGAGLLLLRPDSIWASPIGFVVVKVNVRQISLPVLQFPLSVSFHQSSILIHSLLTLYNLSNVKLLNNTFREKLKMNDNIQSRSSIFFLRIQFQCDDGP